MAGRDRSWKNNNAGTWSLSYTYRDVEADALIGVCRRPLAAAGAQTSKGHKFTLVYQLAKNSQVALNYYDAQRTRNGVNTDHNVILADFTIKF
jgi:hypothetical protein